MGRIHFFEESTLFQLTHPVITRQWIERIIKKNYHQTGIINYVFCSDEYLHQINLKYLNHDTYTDIITFDQSESKHEISGDIFISIERVKENSNRLNLDFDEELHRVMAHGVLHLLGMSDATELQKTTMRKRENAYLSLWANLKNEVRNN